MDNPSFAEIRKRFEEKSVVPVLSPKVPTKISEPSVDPSTSQRLERRISDGSNQSSDDANSTTSDPTASPSYVSDEISSTHNTKQASLLHEDSNPSTILKKPPVPLPSFTREDGNECTQTELSSDSRELSVPLFGPNDSEELYENLHSAVSTMSQNSMPHSLLTLRANGFAGFNRPPVPLPSSANHNQNENTYSEPSPVSQDSVSHPVITQNTNNSTSSTKPSVPLPSFVNRDETESSSSECLLVSLDTMLPLKCMFFEHEHIINNYQRRDPRTIIHPKLKPTMPEMTTNEIDMVQRYSNS